MSENGLFSNPKVYYLVYGIQISTMLLFELLMKKEIRTFWSGRLKKEKEAF